MARIIPSASFDFEKEGYDTVITSCMYLSHDLGAYTREEFAEYKKASTLAAQKRIIFVIDHTRIGGEARGSPYLSFDELKDRDYIIVTDSNLADDNTRERVESERDKFLRAGKRFEFAALGNSG
jgi:hypothetical protein